MTAFPTTIWGVIRGAGARRADETAALVQAYRPAVVRFAQLRGLAPDEAEDVAQEVFLRLFDDAVLTRADRARGRFRNLLLAVTRHTISHHLERGRAAKRGGGRAPQSLDAPELDAALAAPEVDRDFDREWFACLLGQALGRLRQQNETAHACLHGFLVEELPQRELGQRLGLSEAAVRNAIWRGRAQLSAILRELVTSYSSSPGEHEEELRYLATFLAPAPPA